MQAGVIFQRQSRVHHPFIPSANGVQAVVPPHAATARRMDSGKARGNVPAHRNGLLQHLPTLTQPPEKTAAVAQAILDHLGDPHSQRFYHLVAAKVPEGEVRRALEEIKAAGTQQPAKRFTRKMKRYALQWLKQRVGEAGGFS